MKKCVVSDDIFHVFGRRFMARSEVVKEMWAYIKKHELYDKKNKQFIVPDETLRPIFKSKFKVSVKISFPSPPLKFLIIGLLGGEGRVHI